MFLGDNFSEVSSTQDSGYQDANQEDTPDSVTLDGTDAAAGADADAAVPTESSDQSQVDSLLPTDPSDQVVVLPTEDEKPTAPLPEKSPPKLEEVSVDPIVTLVAEKPGMESSIV